MACRTDGTLGGARASIRAWGWLGLGRPAVATALVLCGILAGCGATPRPTAVPPAASAQHSAAAGPGLTLGSLHMVSASVGWAISGGSVLRTTDGGAAWGNVTPGGVLPRGTVLRAFSLNAADAWAVVRGDMALTIYRTTDGGAAWRSAALATGSLRVSCDFVDPRHGWLLVDTGAVALQEAVSIYATADGGATWALVSRTGPAGASPGGLPFPGGKGGIAFSSPTVGWVAVNPPIPGGSVVYETTDGGRTWARRALPAPAVSGGLVYVYRPWFFSPSTGLAPVQIIVPPAHTGDAGRLLWTVDETHDGGRSWSTQPAAPGGGLYSWLDAQHGWQVVGPNLESTSDGGRTWTAIPVHRSLSAVRQLDFVSLEVGWALESGPGGTTVLLRTTDGGRNWAPLG